MGELREVPPPGESDVEDSLESELKLPDVPNWYDLARNKSDDDIRDEFSDYVVSLLKAFEVTTTTTWLALMDADGSVGSHMANSIFDTLNDHNADKARDVALILFSRGGRIEPAYQVAKVCKKYAKNRFIALVPRFAKSAATLIAIGADEIHIGPLGELGPIDPQITVYRR
jgi:hypothetical protein